MVDEKVRQELPEGAVILDDPSFDKSIVGWTWDGRIVYSYWNMVAELSEDDGISFEEAADVIQYDTMKAIPYFGEKAPIIIDLLEDFYFGGDG